MMNPRSSPIASLQVEMGELPLELRMVQLRFKVCQTAIKHHKKKKKKKRRMGWKGVGDISLKVLLGLKVFNNSKVSSSGSGSFNSFSGEGGVSKINVEVFYGEDKFVVHRKDNGIPENFKAKVREAMKKKTKYKLLEYNCVHFALELLDVESESTAPLQRVSPSTSAQKITADGGDPPPLKRLQGLRGNAPAALGGPERPPCVGLYGQYSGGLVYQPPRGSSFSPLIQDGATDPPVVPGETPLSENSLYNGTVELESSRPFEARVEAWRMTTSFRGGGADMAEILQSPGGSVCNLGDLALSPLVFSLSHPAPLGLDIMVQTLELQNFRERSLGRSPSPPGSTSLAGQTMVHGPGKFLQGGISMVRGPDITPVIPVWYLSVRTTFLLETKWKGSKARNIGGGFKLFYHGVDGKRNGVGVILKGEYSKSVVEVKRLSDRVMIVKVEVEGMMINVISAYAPQVGCEMEEKERFWSELDEVVDGVPRKERLVIGADFNGHVGEGNRGDEEVMGRYGFKERNVEGQMVVDFAKRMEMAVVNTYFMKKEDHRVTYKSGGRCTQVDYVLCRRCNLKEIGDCEVVMDRLTDEVRQESPWTMMFADDIVICGESREQVEKSLERWRYALERRGMKLSRSKTEYMCVNEREGSGVMRLQGEEVEKVEEFRYLESTVQ
ncbi:hypothetical protein C0J45_3576 [Silurus meridionalis]|nr:hypothetical protein C0J45_3576 [Silurus meridionalis]